MLFATHPTFEREENARTLGRDDGVGEEATEEGALDPTPEEVRAEVPHPMGTWEGCGGMEGRWGVEEKETSPEAEGREREGNSEGI